MEDEGYKTLNAILEQDPRSEIAGRMMAPFSTLESWHAYVDSVQLNQSVPVEVRRNFNRAKNLSLYAWYVYDFHQVAEMDAFSTVEMALKIRLSDAVKKLPRGLSALFELACNRGYLRNEEMTRYHSLAKFRNDLAHGTTALHEMSVSTLGVCATWINQIYENP